MGNQAGTSAAPARKGDKEERKGRDGNKGGGDSSKRLLDYYTVGEMLGQGTFGVVYACKPKGQDRECAVKMVDKVETPVDKIREEAEFLRKMNHPNVIKCYDVIYEKCFVCIVMDRLSGGDLILGMQAHWKSTGRIPFTVSSRLANQMGSSVQYLHSQNMIHRDIKGDNYLTDRKDITDPDCRVVLTDFGTGMTLAPGQRLHEKCGTKLYWSPEFFKMDYSLKVDVWAMGVVVYGLLCGRFPFRNEAEANKKALTFSEDTPPEAQSLSKGMLGKTEDTRLAADEVMAHQFLSRRQAQQAKKEEKASPPETKDAKETKGYVPTSGEEPTPAPAAGTSVPDPVEPASVPAAPGSKEEDEALFKEFGANVGVQDRRFELVDRLVNAHAKIAMSKAQSTWVTEGGIGEHVWNDSFSIVDKRAHNSTVKYEWVSPSQLTDDSLGIHEEAGGVTKLEGAKPISENDAGSSLVVKKQLEDHGIDTTVFGTGQFKTLDQLAAEVHSGAAVLMLDAQEHKKLVRVVDIVLLRICTPGSKVKYLIESSEQYPDGRRRSTNRLPGTKKDPHENSKQTTERIVAQMLELGGAQVSFDYSNSEQFEEEEDSPSYPGVRTVYRKEIIEGRLEEGAVVAKNDELSHQDATGNTKFFTWMEPEQCEREGIHFKSPEEDGETSALVQAPIGLDEEALRIYLKLYKVDTEQFGQNHAKTLTEFSDELLKGDSSLMHDTDGSIIRVVDVVLLKLTNGENEKILVQAEQTYPDGTKVMLHRLPGAKRRPDENQFLAARKIVQRQLRIDSNHVTCGVRDVSSVEEEKQSLAYPGLRTVYRKRIVSARLSR